MTKKAVILLSGGLDSATALAAAQADSYQCYTLAVDYGQRHRAELKASQKVSKAGGAIKHQQIKMDLAAFGGSSLTDETMSVSDYDAHSTSVPLTYVPARNTIFLATALAYAEVVGAEALYIGVTAVDYSGYPDCRQEFIDAFEQMANLATVAAVEENQPIQIKTPLIDLSKADIIRMGTKLGVDYGLTVSCYQADDAGRACGRCDACHHRKLGFEQAAIADPTHYQSNQ
ncbi:MAG: 7-cyano-7-deazaguanine synthase QueC [Proteobacteria bacterium]|nr:MAG: 7-cyano-7-deazaguanine synthase QueC [Pseudomonadota bacterium]